MTMRSAAAAALAATAVLACAGCGGAIRPDELERGVKSLESTAAEGQLLARQAARGRLRDPFTRAHARDLADTATHEAEKLNDAGASAATASAKRDATQLAQDISDALGQLQVAPADRMVAGQTERKLRDAVTRASDLAQKL